MPSTATWLGKGDSGVTINGEEIAHGATVVGPQSLVETLLGREGWEASSASEPKKPTAAPALSEQTEGTPISSTGAADSTEEPDPED